MSRAARRSRARSVLVQALYQWQMTGQDVSQIETQFLEEAEEMADADVEYFTALLHEVPAKLKELDAHISPYLDRSITQVDPVERAILRLGACELALHPEIPYRVVINEGVELAKRFGAEQGHKYINSILDKVARELRAVEVNAKR